MYKRFFFSKATAHMAFIGIVIMCVGECVTGIIAGGMSRFDYFDMAARLFLSIFLFNGYKKHNILAMQGGCSGLLVCMMYCQSSYLLNEMFRLGVDSFVDLGFWGSLYLAGELMLLIIEVILTVNHYILFILKKHNYLRVSANQTTIVIMLLFLLFQLFVVIQLPFEWRKVVYYGIFNLEVISVYMLIACVEVVLAIDGRESEE